MPQESDLHNCCCRQSCMVVGLRLAHAIVKASGIAFFFCSLDGPLPLHALQLSLEDLSLDFHSALPITQEEACLGVSEGYKAYKESWNRWQVRHTIWWQFEEAD